jgi:putative ABC transport system permease protein
MFGRRKRSHGDFAGELQAHLRLETDRLREEGYSEEEARAMARRNLGNITKAQERFYEAHRWLWLDHLIQDLRYGLRQLRRNPGFTAVAIITLAIGIGANTAIFSVVNSVLLQPLPYRDPSRLVMVYHVPPAKSFPGMTRFAVSPANYLDWRRQNHVFDPLAIYGFHGMNLTRRVQPESVIAAKVSAGFFSALGVPPRIGRVFTADEERPGHANEVILGNSFWHAHFGSNQNIVGQHLSFDGQIYTIIGVMPANFQFPGLAQVWVPLGWTAKDRAIRSNHNYLVIGRLKNGVSLTHAQAEMNTISSRLAQQYPNDDAGWGSMVLPLRQDLVGDVRPALLVLLGAVGFVLLIACANVANLVLEKIIARRKEIAIRTALGAGRGRVLRQILSESSLLAVAGGALGLLFAHFGVALIVDFLAQKLPRASEIGLDGWVLAFTLVISLLTGVVAGIAAAWHLTKSDLNRALKEGLGRTDSDSGGNRTRGVLVVAEVALSLVLLIGAGLLIRTLWALRNADPGFDPHNVLTFSLAISQAKYPQPAQRIRFFDQLLKQVRALPGVESAGATDNLPLAGNNSNWPIAVEGRPAGTLAEQPEVDTCTVSPGYFRTMRVPLLRGRFFNESDRPGTQPVIVISEAMAKRFWPNQDPLGRHLTTAFDPGASLEVVGVVGNVKDRGLARLSPVATMYVPLFQLSDTVISLVVRTAVDPASMISAVSSAVHQIDPDQPLQDVMSMDDVLNDSLSQQRFSMILLATFAGLALLLATIGIYGVIAYSVSKRTHEIGVRVALGAQRTDILKLVVGEGILLVVIGIGIGIAVAIGLTHILASMLYGVHPADPMTFVGVSLILTGVALLASYIPARRATKVDPIVALRYE